MSNNNYTKYSGFSKPQESPVVEPEVKVEEPVTPTTEEPVVTPEDPVTPEPTVEEEKEIIGVVAGCKKLNVRKEPVSDAEVLTTIPVGAEVKVDTSESTNGFYKVCTEAGVEGYCKEDFININ